MHREFLKLTTVAFVALSGAVLFSSATLAGEFGTANVHTMPGGDKVNGAAWLIRSDDGVEGSFETSGLTPGDAVTLWWVIFNNPEACSDNCGSDDFAPRGGNPEVMSSLLWGDGAIIGDDGMAHFRSRVGNANSPGEVSHGPGLIDPYKAEIHLVVRTHGPAVEDNLAAQLTTAKGGCDECPNIQGATFKSN